MIRPLAALGAAVLAVAALTACTPNDVNPALSWLDGQDGVAEATVVVDRTSMFGTSGVIRGELEPGIDGARLDLLVDRVAGYARDHGSVELRLGVADVDFVVDDDAALAREYWAELSELDDLVAAVASGESGVRVHVMRDVLRDTVRALETFPAAVEVEGFRDAETEQLHRGDDDYGPAGWNDGSFQFLRGADCDPSDDAWSQLAITAGYDAIDEGTVDACGGYDLTYRDQTDLAVVAAEWAEVQRLAPEPAPTFVVKENGAAYHEISVTPGDAAMFPVVAGFEAPDAPLTQYVLPGDGTLVLRDWDESPASALLDILTASPLAAQLASISLEGSVEGPVGGETVTAIGTLDQLGSLVVEAEALFPLDPAFYQVAIAPDSVRIDLYSPPGTDPDTVATAAALRSNPIWTTRDTAVYYLNGYVLIHDGVAELGSETYDKPEPLEAFRDAWNAG